MKCKDCKISSCVARDTSTAGEKICPFSILYPSDPRAIITQPEFDWWSFQYNAAKDILAALVSSPEYRTHTDEELVVSAISLTDELIRQLKQSQNGNT